MDSLWDQGVTKQLIFNIYGKDQMLLTRDSLVSMVERADFASFHIHEVTLRWDQHISEVRDLPMGEVLASTCDDRNLIILLHLITTESTEAYQRCS